MAASKNLTKAELLARIDAAEAAAAAFERQRDEIAAAWAADAAHYEQRLAQGREMLAQARTTQGHSRSHDFPVTVVTMNGVPHKRITRMEYGRKVTTYTPVEQH